VSLAGQRIVLGVSGGVAAFKAVDICRRLTALGAHVTPVLTDAALHFIGKATFDALASAPAVTSMWDGPDPSPHTTLGKAADLILVAPATADIMAKAAAGMANDVLSATLLASAAPVLFAVAMHTEMWEHPATQENLATLRRRGAHLVEPVVGALASGDYGKGRMADPAEIVETVVALLGPKDLSGVRMVISAGGTREAIDPVRFIGNRSSGKQGFAIAHAAAQRGAAVVVVSTVGLAAPAGSAVVRVESAADMAQAMHAAASDADVIVMAAAVADFRPSIIATSKIKKHGGAPEVILEPTVDILSALGATKRQDQTLVGFAAETNDLRANALDKLHRKNLDLIVANDVSAEGVGFEHETNAVTMYERSGFESTVALSDKRRIAHAVLDRVVAIRSSASETPKGSTSRLS
jgi:phosphopantothenoylcysteine decarboxylase / phosphopantothenate---cysteine ligase